MVRRKKGKKNFFYKARLRLKRFTYTNLLSSTLIQQSLMSFYIKRLLTCIDESMIHLKISDSPTGDIKFIFPSLLFVVSQWEKVANEIDETVQLRIL